MSGSDNRRPSPEIKIPEGWREETLADKGKTSEQKLKHHREQAQREEHMKEENKRITELARNFQEERKERDDKRKAEAEILADPKKCLSEVTANARYLSKDEQKRDLPRYQQAIAELVEKGLTQKTGTIKGMKEKFTLIENRRKSIDAQVAGMDKEVKRARQWYQEALREQSDIPQEDKTQFELASAKTGTTSMSTSDYIKKSENHDQMLARISSYRKQINDLNEMQVVLLRHIDHQKCERIEGAEKWKAYEDELMILKDPEKCFSEIMKNDRYLSHHEQKRDLPRYIQAIADLKKKPEAKPSLSFFFRQTPEKDNPTINEMQGKLADMKKRAKSIDAQVAGMDYEIERARQWYQEIGQKEHKTQFNMQTEVTMSDLLLDGIGRTIDDIKKSPNYSVMQMKIDDLRRSVDGLNSTQAQLLRDVDPIGYERIDRIKKEWEKYEKDIKYKTDAIKGKESKDPKEREDLQKWFKDITAYQDEIQKKKYKSLAFARTDNDEDLQEMTSRFYGMEKVTDELKRLNKFLDDLLKHYHIKDPIPQPSFIPYDNSSY
jgi:hypothetical protein